MIHDLTNTQLRQATENSASLAGDYRSNYSTYTMFEAINSCQTEMDTKEIHLAPYFSIQINETMNNPSYSRVRICPINNRQFVDVNSLEAAQFFTFSNDKQWKLIIL